MNEMRKLIEAVEQLDEAMLFRNPNEMVKYMMRELQKIENMADYDAYSDPYNEYGEAQIKILNNVYEALYDLRKRMKDAFPAYTE